MRPRGGSARCSSSRGYSFYRTRPACVETVCGCRLCICERGVGHRWSWGGARTDPTPGAAGSVCPGPVMCRSWPPGLRSSSVTAAASFADTERPLCQTSTQAAQTFGSRVYALVEHRLRSAHLRILARRVWCIGRLLRTRIEDARARRRGPVHLTARPKPWSSRATVPELIEGGSDPPRPALEGRRDAILA